jgi:hypothetical protein
MTNKEYRVLIKKVNDYLEKLNPFGAVMIMDCTTDEVKMFDRTEIEDCPYYTAVQYMLMICTQWISSNTYAIEDNYYTPEKLLELCITENDFGSVMGVYIQDENFNFIRIGY